MGSTPVGSTPVGKIIASEPPRVGLGEFVPQPDGSVAVPVVVDRMDGMVSGEFEIGRLAGSVEVMPGPAVEGYSFISHRDGDMLKVAFAGTGSKVEGGEILRLKFSQKPKSLRLQVRLNEYQSQTLSTAVEAKSWGAIKSSFVR